MNNFRRLHKFWKIYKNIENVQAEKLTPEDRANIGGLYVNPQYKSFAKLIDSIILDLTNKSFREAQNADEFLGVKWSIAALTLVKQTIKSNYDQIIKNPYGKAFKQEATSNESFESIPSEETSTTS